MFGQSVNDPPLNPYPDLRRPNDPIPKDPNVTVKTGSKGTYMEFLVGEHPKLPSDGTKFRRLSSKVSGPQTRLAVPYIQGVHKIAKKRFGERIKWWHELWETYRHYGWSEVMDTEQSFLS
ncbi:unnamed protein product [Calypogeia fissa]